MGGTKTSARLALVTGGHRRLGAAISHALARLGYDLALHGSLNASPEASLAEALEAHGTVWSGFACDFADPQAAETLVGKVADDFGRAPDLLVNNAAIFGQDRIDSVRGDDLSRHFAVNLSAPVLLTRAFAAISTSSDSANLSIVNILDQRIRNPHGDQLAYTLSKIALAGFTQIAARELAPRIRVNAIAPGLAMPTVGYGEGQMRALEQAMPLGRLPDPDEVAATVLYLAEATVVTGQCIYVDGGAHMSSYARDFLHLRYDGDASVPEVRESVPGDRQRPLRRDDEYGVR